MRVSLKEGAVPEKKWQFEGKVEVGEAQLGASRSGRLEEWRGKYVGESRFEHVYTCSIEALATVP